MILVRLAIERWSCAFSLLQDGAGLRVEDDRGRGADVRDQVAQHVALEARGHRVAQHALGSGGTSARLGGGTGAGDGQTGAGSVEAGLATGLAGARWAVGLVAVCGAAYSGPPPATTSAKAPSTEIRPRRLVTSTLPPNAPPWRRLPDWLRD